MPSFEAWARVNNEELQGNILCLREKNGVFLHSTDIPPGLEKLDAYAMILHLPDHYINEAEIPASNVSRTISHSTEMLDFLGNFCFEGKTAPCG